MTFKYSLKKIEHNHKIVFQAIFLFGINANINELITMRDNYGSVSQSAVSQIGHGIEPC